MMTMFFHLLAEDGDAVVGVEGAIDVEGVVVAVVVVVEVVVDEA